MKTDKLEQFILENKAGFRSNEKTPDVWDKIIKREPKNKIYRFNWKFVISRAAVFAGIFITSYYFHVYRAAINSSKLDSALTSQIEKEPLYKELLEAELYYDSQIKFKKNELFSLTDDKVLQKDVIQDLSDLDAILLRLKVDLSDNADNQDVIEAMIQNYMLKLEILEDMLRQLKQETDIYDKNHAI